MKKLRYILLFAVILAFTAACKKEHYTDGGVRTGKLNMNVYDFLKSRPFEFDTIVWILDKTGLAEAVKQHNITFFAPRDLSVVNYLKRIGGAKLDTVNVDTLRKAMSKYIFPGKKVWRDSIPLEKSPEGGMLITSLNGYQMYLDTWRDAYNGIPNAGPIFIRIWDPHGYTASPIRRFDPISKWPELQNRYNPWVNSGVITSNLEATNGVVHAVAGTHTFNFPY